MPTLKSHCHWHLIGIQHASVVASRELSRLSLFRIVFAAIQYGYSMPMGASKQNRNQTEQRIEVYVVHNKRTPSPTCSRHHLPRTPLFRDQKSSCFPCPRRRATFYVISSSHVQISGRQRGVYLNPRTRRVQIHAADSLWREQEEGTVIRWHRDAQLTTDGAVCRARP